MKFRLLCIATGIALSVFPACSFAQDAQEESAASSDSADEREQEEAPEERGVRRLGDVIGEGGSDFSMDIPQVNMPAAPVSEQPDVSLPDPAMDDRLQNILARRAFVPDNPEIEQELASLLDEVEAQAREALAAGEIDLATRFVNVIAEFDDERDVIAQVAAESERLAEIERLPSRRSNRSDSPKSNACWAWPSRRWRLAIW